MQGDMQTAIRARWAVAAMFLVNGFVVGAWAPQIPLLLPRHDIDKATLGLLILGLGLGAVGSMLFTGRLIARFGARAVVRAFALALVPMLLVVVLSPSVPMLALAMAALGATMGCMDVAMNANAVEVERRLGRAIMSSSHGFWSLGGFIGASAGGVVVAHFGAEAQALAVAGVALTLVLLAGPRLLHSAPQPEQETRARSRLLPRDPAVWLLGAMALFCMVPEGAVLDWAALYLAQNLGAAEGTAALAFAGFSATMAIMRFAGDTVRNRFGAVQTLRVSGLVATGGMALAAVAPDQITAIAAFAICGLGVANMVPIMFSAAGNYPGLAPGAAIAAVTMMGYSGILVAPSTIGFVAEHIGFRVTFAALALVLLAVVLLAGRVAVADGVRGQTSAAT